MIALLVLWLITTATEHSAFIGGQDRALVSALTNLRDSVTPLITLEDGFSYSIPHSAKDSSSTVKPTSTFPPTGTIVSTQCPIL